MNISDTAIDLQERQHVRMHIELSGSDEENTQQAETFGLSGMIQQNFPPEDGVLQATQIAIPVPEQQSTEYGINSGIDKIVDNHYAELDCITYDGQKPTKEFDDEICILADKSTEGTESHKTIEEVMNPTEERNHCNFTESSEETFVSTVEIEQTEDQNLNALEHSASYCNPFTPSTPATPAISNFSTSTPSSTIKIEAVGKYELRDHKYKGEEFSITNYEYGRMSYIGNLLLELLSPLDIASDRISKVKVTLIRPEDDNSDSGFYICLEISDAEGNILYQSASEKTSRKEKMFHNMDKNLLEFFTTKTFLKKIKCPEPLITQLRDINSPAGGQSRLKEFEKELIWERIKDENKPSLDHFKEMVLSKEEYFEKYMLKGNINNKTKKSEKKLELLADRIFSRSFAPTEDFLRNLLKQNDMKLDIKKTIGEAVEKLFIKKLLSEQFNVNRSYQDSRLLVKEHFEKAIVEINIYKIFWALASKDEVLGMVTKLVRTRLITSIEKKEEKDAAAKVSTAEVSTAGVSTAKVSTETKGFKKTKKNEDVVYFEEEDTELKSSSKKVKKSKN